MRLTWRRTGSFSIALAATVVSLAHAQTGPDTARDRVARARELEQSRDLADGALAKLLADDDESVRLAATRALGRIAAPLAMTSRARPRRSW